MRAQPSFHLLGDHCRVVWDFIEDIGFLLGQIPTEKDGEKYPFMSRLQNVAFERSLDHDLLVFNYADFIWADGSLPATVELMGPDVDAVLSFCLPVDSGECKRTLDKVRADDGASDVLTLPPRVSAGIACDHLHDEARLRMWDGPEFTTTPTYLIWPVADEGLVVRAYHQTILALRVRANNPDYRAGIRRGTLDGYFSAELADSGCIRFASNSDQVLVFSLYDAITSTRLKRGQTREAAIRKCLRDCVSTGQRRFADVPIQIRRSFPDHAQWASVEERSQEILTKLHDEVPPDATTFLRHASSDEIARLEARWRVAPSSVQSTARTYLAGPMRTLVLGILCVLRSLYLDRLLATSVVPWLGPAQKQWILHIGSRTPRIEWTDLCRAVSNLGAPVLHLLESLVGELKRAVGRAARRIGLARVRGPGD
jgi:hypothetical protein